MKESSAFMHWYVEEALQYIFSLSVRSFAETFTFTSTQLKHLQMLYCHSLYSLLQAVRKLIVCKHFRHD